MDGEVAVPVQSTVRVHCCRRDGVVIDARRAKSRMLAMEVEEYKESKNGQRLIA